MLEKRYYSKKRMNRNKIPISFKILQFYHWKNQTMINKGYNLKNDEDKKLFSIESYKLHKFRDFRGY